jgi:DNA-binding NarL/FixJ family response regulator
MMGLSNQQELVENLLEAGPAPRVLVVEDELGVAKLFDSLLRSAGFRVHVVHSIQAALKWAHDLKFDAALVDVFLPDGSGLQVVEVLRDLTKPCASVVITGSPSGQLVRGAIRLGVVDFLFKPFDADTLVFAVARAAGTTQAWREREAEASGLIPVPHTAPNGPAQVFDVEIVTRRIAKAHDLTDQEVKVLALMFRGRRNEEMSRALSISSNTIKFHVRNVLKKLDLRTRTELFRLLVD